MVFDGDRELRYNARNQLTHVSMRNEKRVDYEYDYTGARVKKRVEYTDAYARFHQKETHYLGDALEIKDGNLLIHIHVGSRKIAMRGMGPVQQFVAMAGGPFVDRGFEPQVMSASIVVPCLVFFFVILILLALRRSHESLFETLAHFHIHRWGKVLSLLLAFIFFIQMPSMAYAQAGGQLQQIVGDVDYFVYYQDDHLGSSSIITEGRSSARHSGLVYKKGEVLQRFEYSPFGNSRYVMNPTLSFDPSYTGQTYDGDTGLYYYKSRFYDPRLGRFVQPDTIVPQAKNLQAYNRYAYVSNNPLKYVDPTGHFWGFFRKIVGAFVAAFVATFVATLVTVALLPVLGPGAFVVGALAAGAAGGVVNGAITGGLRGAIYGLAGGIETFTKNLLTAGTYSIYATVQSFRRDGWKALVTFGASVAGAIAGGYAGAAVNRKLASRRGTGGPNEQEAQALDNVIEDLLGDDPVEDTFQLNTDEINPGDTFQYGGEEYIYGGSNEAYASDYTPELTVDVIAAVGEKLARKTWVTAGLTLVTGGSYIIKYGVIGLVAGPAGIFAGAAAVIIGSTLVIGGLVMVSEGSGATDFLGIRFRP